MRLLLTTLHSKFIHPSLALPYLASYCSDLDMEISIQEYTIHEPRESVLASLLKQKPNVLGFSVYLWNRVATLEVIAALHQVDPELKIFVGGPEVSFEGSDFLDQHPGIRALVHGEGEVPVRALLEAWSNDRDPVEVTRVTYRDGSGDIHQGPLTPSLVELDTIPSPFQSGLVDLSRGFVYIETSRGCPYDCAFCMSALDDSVRSFGMERIKSDLGFLMKQEVPKIKLVDRTFNYQASRTREIFRFILDNNRSSHFHFEIGAHLLDDDTLELLKQVPSNTFQFEIGVQSTLPDTLKTIRRQASFDALVRNVKRLREIGTIELHLDLIAGLPGESYEQFLDSIDRVIALEPDHLQIEPVKLLPGAPLRRDADALGIVFDPAPPYQVLRTPELTFEEIGRLCTLSRLLDLSWNSHRLTSFLQYLADQKGTFSRGLAHLAAWFDHHELLRHPLSQQGLFDALYRFVCQQTEEPQRSRLIDCLGYDFALCERVSPNKVPPYLSMELSPEERQTADEQVRLTLQAIQGQGIKLQHFAAVFHHLTSTKRRQAVLFLYQTAPGRRMSVTAMPLDPPERN